MLRRCPLAKDRLCTERCAAYEDDSSEDGKCLFADALRAIRDYFLHKQASSSVKHPVSAPPPEVF